MKTEGRHVKIVRYITLKARHRYSISHIFFILGPYKWKEGIEMS